MFLPSMPVRPYPHVVGTYKNMEMKKVEDERNDGMEMKRLEGIIAGVNGGERLIPDK